MSPPAASLQLETMRAAAVHADTVPAGIVECQRDCFMAYSAAAYSRQGQMTSSTLELQTHRADSPRTVLQLMKVPDLCDLLVFIHVVLNLNLFCLDVRSSIVHDPPGSVDCGLAGGFQQPRGSPPRCSYEIMASWYC